MGWQIATRMSTNDPSEKAGSEMRAVPVILEPGRTLDLQHVAGFTGTLEANARFTVAPKISGRLENLRVNIRNPVENGEFLAELDSHEYVQEVSEAMISRPRTPWPEKSCTWWKAPGVTDASISRESGAPERLIHVDRSKGESKGVDIAQIGNVLQTSLSGTQAGNYREGGRVHNSGQTQGRRANTAGRDPGPFRDKRSGPARGAAQPSERGAGHRPRGIMLGGILVNNAILLVDQTNQLRRNEGMPMFPAIEEAGRRRLRPILMTALTTIFGLLPLSLGLGEGGEAQAPMARAVIGSLASSTLITLVVVPVMYSLIPKKWS